MEPSSPSKDDYIVVIGGANMDIFGRFHSDLIFADSNPGKLKTSAGGVGRNIADYLGRLGNKTEFIGAIGDDKWGEELQNACREANVSLEHSIILQGGVTSCYLSLHESQGEMVIALNDMELIDAITPEKLLLCSEIINRASVMVIDANLNEQTIKFIFDRYSHKIIFVDPVSSIKAYKLLPYLERIHTLKPNKQEVEILSGFNIESNKDLLNAAKYLHDKGIIHLLISLGEGGVFSSTYNEQKLIPSKKTRVSNVTGAGDALMAGLVHSHFAGKSWNQCVDFALSLAYHASMTEQTINTGISNFIVKDIT